MKVLFTTLLLAVSSFTAVAQDSTALSCSLTVVQSNIGILDSKSKTSFPEFFSFKIDPKLSDQVAWIYTNRCLSRKEISGAKFSGTICLLVYSSDATAGDQKLFIDLGHYSKTEANPLRNLGASKNRRVGVTIPFPRKPFTIEVSPQAGGVDNLRLECK